MKYLKTFENSEEIEFGVTPEDIEYLFTDISDNGWRVDVRFLRKLFDYKHTDKPIFKKFALIPYIEVLISKPTPHADRFSRSPWNESQELQSLVESDEFKEIIEVASLRLDELDLYIQKQSYENNAFNILIYRKTDQNYIK